MAYTTRGLLNIDEYRRKKEIEDQNKRLGYLNQAGQAWLPLQRKWEDQEDDSPMDDPSLWEQFTTWLGDKKNEYLPTMRDEDDVVKRLLAKQDTQNKRLGILEWDQGGEYTDKEVEILSKVSEEKERESIADLGYDDDDFRTVSVRPKELDMHRTPVDTSMVTKDSKSSTSPKMAKLGIDLMTTMMNRPKDAPPPTIRGAGISRGGGTPFPSLLAKKPERPRYVNRGLI